MAFSTPPGENPRPGAAPTYDWQGPKLSRDGRTLLSPWWNKLWEVDSGRVRWSRSDDEPYLSVDPVGVFTVPERWRFPVPQVSWETKSYAMHDLATGAILCRLRNPKSYYLSGDGRFLYDLAAGGARAFPPPPNYLLLGIGQTILALPLLLLWLTLSWRRRRPARRLPAGAAP